MLENNNNPSYYKQVKNNQNICYINCEEILQISKLFSSNIKNDEDNFMLLKKWIKSCEDNKYCKAY
jgi:uncharacterized pyridoxamine 5'-phosphate oxidase family protein